LPAPILYWADHPWPNKPLPPLSLLSISDSPLLSRDDTRVKKVNNNALRYAVRLSFPLASGGHELELEGPDTLSFGVVAFPGLHVDLCSAHGAFSFVKSVDVERGM
jgi:hypothetical protein